jgi:hypothetical protein
MLIWANPKEKSRNKYPKTKVLLQVGWAEEGFVRVNIPPVAIQFVLLVYWNSYF